MQSSFLGFKRIVHDDVRELLEEFCKVKRALIPKKLDDMPTKEENERVIKTLSNILTEIMNRIGRVELLLQTFVKKIDSKM